MQTEGSLGANARVVLLGAKTLGEEFREIGSVPVDDGGSFVFSLGADEYSFFRVRIEIQDVL